jgi:hypothetical protein
MMTPYTYRNARMLADGRIDCEIDHPRLGWLPFTADPEDGVEKGRDTHAQIVADGTAAPYVAPAPKTEAELLIEWRAQAECSPLQGQLALGEERWLRVEAILSDPATPWAMKQTIRTAQVWKRNSQDIDALAWMLGLSEVEVDDLFRLAVTITV